MPQSPFSPFAFLAAAAMACAAAFPVAAPKPAPGTDALEQAEAALTAGDLLAADSLFASATATPASLHRREILRARLAASRGDWKQAEAGLQGWRHNETRREGSGEVLFWLGWAALHQGRLSDADSLFVLASAYPEEPRAQDALEYRFAALLEDSPALQDYLRGLPESPLPEPLREASLRQIPEQSRLHPSALWRLALLLEARGDSIRSREVLGVLSRNPSSISGRRAAAYLAFLRESSRPDSSMAAYEALLLKQQEGVIPEFARQRIRALRRDAAVPE